jgi:hypothetical protein
LSIVTSNTEKVISRGVDAYSGYQGGATAVESGDGAGSSWYGSSRSSPEIEPSSSRSGPEMGLGSSKVGSSRSGLEMGHSSSRAEDEQ